MKQEVLKKKKASKQDPASGKDPAHKKGPAKRADPAHKEEDQANMQDPAHKVRPDHITGTGQPAQPGHTILAAHTAGPDHIARTVQAKYHAGRANPKHAAHTGQKRSRTEAPYSVCPYTKKCGACSMTGVPYGRQLELKQQRIEELFGDACGSAVIEPIAGMASPLHYRAKVHHVFGHDRRGHIVAGFYETGTHRIVDIGSCLIEDKKSQAIIASVRDLAASFKIHIYDEDSGYGLLRHVMVRCGVNTGEYMVILVVTSPIFPGKNNFAKALLKLHPEITTIVLNINDADTSMVLGNRSIPIYGPGFIYDTLMGLKFRISPESFYQVNPVQTEVLYKTAMEFAALTGKENVIDAYCGTGTIGLTAAAHAAHVTGIELNPAAVRDARMNARSNGIKNADFIAADAGEYMESSCIKADVIFMDPPRSGSSEKFLRSAAAAQPQRIVYVSCEPVTLRRDLKYLKKLGYIPDRIRPVDMFPFVGEDIEVVVGLSRRTWDR